MWGVAKVVAVSVSSAAIVIACGPSFRTVVEGDMRFEHCYRIDEDQQTPLQDKRACWHDWTSRYTKGQDRSRVKYAKDRIQVLEGAATGPFSVGTAVASGSVVASPLPSSIYVPPPSTVASVSTSGDMSAANSPNKTQICSDACNKNWRQCLVTCAGTPSCIASCEPPLRECAKTCL